MNVETAYYTVRGQYRTAACRWPRDTDKIREFFPAKALRCLVYTTDSVLAWTLVLAAMRFSARGEVFKDLREGALAEAKETPLLFKDAPQRFIVPIRARGVRRDVFVDGVIEFDAENDCSDAAFFDVRDRVALPGSVARNRAFAAFHGVNRVAKLHASYAKT